MPFVWLGNSQTAHDKKKLVDLGITHILNTAVESDNAFPDMFIYCKIALTDSKEQEFEGVFDHAFKFINRCKESGGKILIHCSAGVSRAASLAVGYIVKQDEQLLIDAYLYVQHLRPIIDINENFLYHLALLEMNAHNVTSVAFHKTWKFYAYTQLKSGADPEWDEGPVARKQGDGVFSMVVFKKLGTPKTRNFFAKLFEDVYGAFHSAKNSQAIAQQRAAGKNSRVTGRASTAVGK
jgi:protein-tyrosine phosphatase